MTPVVGVIGSKAVHELIMAVITANCLAVIAVASTVDALSGGLGAIITPFDVLS